MKLFEKVIDIVYKVMVGLLVVFLLWTTFHFGKIAIDKCVEAVQKVVNQEEQLEELYDNDAWILAVITNINQQQNMFNGAVVQDLINIVKKPSYDYLSSVSLYLFNVTEKNGDNWNGAIGVGVIVAQKGKYSYILTNKHVCNWSNEGNCYVVMDRNNKSTWISLEYIKETESKYDLALWRTRNDLGQKRAIKGLGQSPYPQNPVYSVGHYLGVPFIYTEGTFAGHQGDHDLYNLPCSKGCSGSGIYNKNGKLIGLIFASNLLNQFTGETDTAKIIAVPLEVIRLFLKDLVEG